MYKGNVLKTVIYGVVLTLGTGVVPGNIVNSSYQMNSNKTIEVTKSNLDDYLASRIIDKDKVTTQYVDGRAKNFQSCGNVLREAAGKTSIDSIAVINSRGDRFNLSAFDGGRMCYGTAVGYSDNAPVSNYNSVDNHLK